MQEEEESKLIISVASGKGGTGKTTVAVGIAKALEFCQFLDYDVEAPNASFFLKPSIKNIEKVSIKHPYFLKETGADFSRFAEFCRFNAVAFVKGEVVFFPELCHGCGGCILVGPVEAVREKDVEVGTISKGTSKPGINFLMGNLIPGSMRTISIQNKMNEYIDHDEIVIIDSPPGTSCSMVTTVRNSDYCILVTEPTLFGLNDLEISVEVLKKLDIPFGVIINRDGIGDDCIENFCNNEKIKIIERIPNDINIARAYSRGVTIVEYQQQWKDRFLGVIKEIEKEIN